MRGWCKPTIEIWQGDTFLLYFIDGSLGTKKAQEIVPKVVEKINQYNSQGNSVIYTMDTHDNDYMETQEGKNLPIPHCIYQSKGWMLNDKVADAIYHGNAFLTKELENGKEEENLQEFRKPTFGSIELAKKLFNRKNNLEQIEIVGVCTGICVISNALILKAYLPEVLIQVDASCCACVTPDSHKTALEAMKLCQIKIINELPK